MSRTFVLEHSQSSKNFEVQKSRTNLKDFLIPNHPGEKIGTGLLLKIIKKDLQITREQFEGMI
jgi:predicted RNA binding protein YcfA (HicA-like mRNA interferase family)